MTGCPHWSAVSQVRSLVELHGNRHALRADFSLDAEPSERDKHAALIFAQPARFEFQKDEAKRTPMRECLPSCSARVRHTIRDLDLNEPTLAQLRATLESFQMLSRNDMSQLEREAVV